MMTTLTRGIPETQDAIVHHVIQEEDHGRPRDRLPLPPPLIHSPPHITSVRTLLTHLPDELQRQLLILPQNLPQTRLRRIKLERRHIRNYNIHQNINQYQSYALSLNDEPILTKMLDRLESIVNHKFENKARLHRALMRKDNLATKPGTRTVIEFPSLESRIQLGDQTALETLGDAVIYVYLLEKQIQKGARSREEMHNQKRDYGKNLSLNKIAENIKLQDFVYWSENEEKGRIWEKANSFVLADCFEALIGAIYMDGGMKSVTNTLDTLKFLEIYQETPTLSELEKKVHKCKICNQTDLKDAIFHHPVYSFGDPSGKEILVVGINPSTKEFEDKYLSDIGDLSERHQSQMAYFQQHYYDFFKKIEEFFGGKVKGKIGWVDSPWEKIGFIDLVKCSTRTAKGQWGGLKGSQKRRLIKNCQKHLISQLEELKPKIIIPYGADVCKWFSKRHNIAYEPFTSQIVFTEGKETKILFLKQKQGPYKVDVVENIRNELYQMI